MTRGSIELAAFGALLDRDDEAVAHVRALLRRAGNGWSLGHLWALIGFEPPHWGDGCWRYAEVALVACSIPRANLAVLCSEDDTGSITLGGLDVDVPKAQGPVSWRREPSYAHLDRAPLSRPTTDYRIVAAKRDSSSVPDSMLVSTGCPSFPELNSAWRAFTEGDFGLAGAPAPPDDLATIRIAESRGWIGDVHITPAQASVNVHGDALADCELELYGLTNRVSHRLDDPEQVVFSLADGLPRHAWLWLKHETTWLDYRSLDPHSGYTGELAGAGVDIDLPIEPQAIIEALIAAGEGPLVEFKEQLVDGRQLKTVAAFANGDGGTIVFGINRDETTITGLGGDGRQLRDRIGDLIRAAILPTPKFTTTEYIIAGKKILVVEVAPGNTPPYGVIANSGYRDKPEFFVRRGANTYPAQPNDIREAVLGR